jgi:nicotinamide-nucleotide amidase
MEHEKTSRHILFNTEILNEIKNRLVSKKQTLGVAESVTTGLLQTAFGSTLDASQFFQGGITVYNIGQKHHHLRVEPIHALSCNCVSENVAVEMAINICDFFSCHWGIAITGYAAPVTELKNEVFAYYAISFNKEIKSVQRTTCHETEPFAVQLFYTNIILEHLKNLLL